jgi:hypothetical protein
MLLQPRLGCIFAELLSKSPLVHCGVALEDGRSDPGLENEPSTSVHTANFLAAKGKRRGAPNWLSVRVNQLGRASGKLKETYRGEAEVKANRLTAADRYCATIVLCVVCVELINNYTLIQLCGKYSVEKVSESYNFPQRYSNHIPGDLPRFITQCTHTHVKHPHPQSKSCSQQTARRSSSSPRELPWLDASSFCHTAWLLSRRCLG